jgi:hypothetical protein
VTLLYCLEIEFFCELVRTNILGIKYFWTIRASSYYKALSGTNSTSLPTLKRTLESPGSAVDGLSQNYPLVQVLGSGDPKK